MPKTHIHKELVEQILELPNAPLLVDELNKVLKKEKARRVDFYENISGVFKSEFINGEVIVHSPVIKSHNEVNGNLYKILDTFVVDRDLGFVGIEKLLIQLTRNDYEPDICFFGKEKAKSFEAGQKFFPPPDLVVEVLSTSTEQRDRGIKFQDYQNHGIESYWLVDPVKKFIEQYRLEDGSYTLILKSDTGEIHTRVIPGLVIPIPTIFDKKLTNTFIRSL